MKRLSIFSIVFFVSVQAFSWGQTGHRVVGEIAWAHLSKKAKKNVAAVLGNESLAMCSNFMDEIKSDTSYDHTHVWHYCTIPDSSTYEQAGTPEEGDVIWAIKKFTNELKTKQFSEGGEAFALKCLVHLVGDIHQPLHVGNGKDKGGNNVSVEYFWETSNLHRVWDEGIISKQNLSYTEYTNWANHPSQNEKTQWMADDVMVWAQESKELRGQVYDLPANKKINYKYNYQNIDVVNKRLLQAGIRLAALLEEIYG